jgi:hypothetical protein
MISTPKGVPNMSGGLGAYEAAVAQRAPNSPFAQPATILGQAQPVQGESQSLRNPSNTGQKTLLGQ